MNNSSVSFYLTGKGKINESIATLIKCFNKDIALPLDSSQFVFLCGGNNNDEPSARRKAILEFGKKHLPNTQFFIAETLFTFLTAEDKHPNLIDLETDISDFSDYVIIVLESNGAYCELGAFSDEKLRNKLIVINDSIYRTEDSFINKGPLQAIKESPDGHTRILHYKMNPGGIATTDSIGAVFRDLHAILHRTKPKRTRKDKLRKEDFDPNSKFDKNSLKFLHDIILIAGPLTKNELIDIFLKKIYGEKDFDKLKYNLAMLETLRLINKTNGCYSSFTHKTFFQYDVDIDSISASFKRLYLKYMPNRIFG